MAANIKYMVGPRDGDMVRFMMTKMYQFDTGEWNDSSVFSYDLDDPMGEQPGARLLTKYLDTRKGNCVSMPTLFLALMERVDPDVPFNGVSAPLHLFCRLHDRQDSSVWNVETTNGGNGMRDVWVVEQFRIPQVAIDSGVYMREF
ncbi:MAG: transglutaminase family protein, partial [Candidatus Zixiibacteriota bacterium]